MATAAALAPVSSAFHGMYSPVIDYSRLSLGRHNVAPVLWGVLSESGHILSGSARLSAGCKLLSLNTCTHLAVDDVPALRHLVDVRQNLDPRFRIFSSVSHLSLGPELVRDLGFASAKSLHADIVALQEMLSPIELCFVYPTETQIRECLRWRYMTAPRVLLSGDELDEDDFGDSLRRYHHYIGIANLVYDFVSAWRPASVTLHGLTEQFLPETPEELPVKMRVFYTASVNVESSQAPEANLRRLLELLEELRAMEMAMRVSLVDGPDDCSFEFIGAGLTGRGTAEPSGGASGGEADADGAAETGARADGIKRDPDVRIREMFWSQFTQPEIRQVIEGQVRFTVRETAEPCSCCGGK